jgi:RNA polymerase sigma-70 factor (ECF subfamily)
MLDEETLQKLYRYGVALTNHTQDAYDLVQDALEKILIKPPRDNNNVTAYLRTVMRNQFIDNYRRQQRFPEVEFDDTTEALDLNTDALEQTFIERDELEKAWQTLDRQDREILFLWAVEGYSYQEIAEQMTLPRGTVLSRIHRVRKNLQTKSANHVSASSS